MLATVLAIALLSAGALILGLGVGVSSEAARTGCDRNGAGLI
ncbi:hypothetical protein [Methylobacterium trifolii]|uniref:Uncharacterized protein n=1 Tax=Methylobacterium trifolii TaxID=1003092 RepID=A0ABQ4U385_9HYPH|nr:hypothetical protein [Methylobacterium trifolii]GJE61934.1 hypothetical protein MPOCJGCO_4062 [Methylobacterium trifolii]